MKQLIRSLTLLIWPAHVFILIVALFTMNDEATAYALFGITAGAVVYLLTLPPYTPPRHPEL